MKHALYNPELSNRSRDEWLSYLQNGFVPAEQDKIAEALGYAWEAYKEDTIIRPRGLDVAAILHQLEVDALTLQVALLSDPYLRDRLKQDSIASCFGHKVANLVDKVNWLNTFEDYRPEEVREPDQAELLRRMVLAVVNDLRAVLVKLAYRLQRLRLLKNADESVRLKVAQETLDIFCPLANRLGIGQLKWELEDLSFRYLEPREYKRLAQGLAVNRAAREQFINGFIEELRQELATHGIAGRVYGRPKHIYSIYRKMHRKGAPLEDLYDLNAVRVLVADVPTCYTVLGLAH